MVERDDTRGQDRLPAARPALPGDCAAAFGFDLPEHAWVARVRAALDADGAFTDDSLEAEQVGQHLGRYELLDVLGEGGMGTVWRARRADKRPDRIVALKLIRRGMESTNAIRRFHLEEQVLARLEHPNIARLYDGGTTRKGRHFLVMEFVEGLPIDQYVVRHRLSVNDILKLFGHVCDAVQYAHGLLVLHRDLKPSNIVITENGTPKLLDFGIAKLLDDGDAGGLTVTDASVLTPRYASPEQVRGEALTTATDVYSLGIILYELLTGRCPYNVATGTRCEFERAVLAQDIPRPSTVVSHRSERYSDNLRRQARLRGDLDTIVLQALQKNPARRYASAELLAADMNRHVRGLPISAAPDSLAHRASRFTKRNKGLVASVLTVVVALLTATLLSTIFALRESHARSEAEKRTREAEAINAFLNDDLLASSHPENSRNPNLTMREALDRAAERIEERFDDQPLVEATIRHTIGQTYLGLRLPADAIPNLRRAADLRTLLLGPLNSETRKATRDLLTALYESDRFEEGIAVGRKLLANDIEAAGPDSADAMDTQHLLAQYGSGDEDGETKFATLHRVLEWNRAHRGRAHPETLSVMHTLANGYFYHHQIEEAAPLVEEAWEIANANYEPSDAESLDARLALGILYGRTDRAEEAVTLIQEAVDILRETRPPDFADTGIWLTHLGIYLSNSGHKKEAEAAFHEAYDILSASLGPEAGWTQGTATILADHYENMGNLERAALWRKRLLPE